MNEILNATAQTVTTVATKYPTATAAAANTAAFVGGYKVAGVVHKVQRRRAQKKLAVMLAPTTQQ